MDIIENNSLRNRINRRAIDLSDDFIRDVLLNAVCGELETPPYVIAYFAIPLFFNFKNRVYRVEYSAINKYRKNEDHTDSLVENVVEAVKGSELNFFLYTGRFIVQHQYIIDIGDNFIRAHRVLLKGQ